MIWLLGIVSLKTSENVYNSKHQFVATPPDKMNVLSAVLNKTLFLKTDFYQFFIWCPETYSSLFLEDAWIRMNVLENCFI